MAKLAMAEASQELAAAREQVRLAAGLATVDADVALQTAFNSVNSTLASLR
jgi:hypothetical protein